MKLLAPEVVAPLSACSTSVQIRGNINGATIHILVNNAETASHVTTSCDGVYDLGSPVQANDVVTARQTLNSDTSDPSLPVTVQAVPSQLSALTLYTVLHECGRAVLMGGGVPGAKVEGRINNQLVGSGKVISGISGFKYDPVLGAGKSLSLKQITCNNLTQTQTTPTALVQPSPLLKPTIQEPLIECQNTITIGGVVDGNFVELYRNNVLETTFTFRVSKEWRGIKPLKKDDKIEVRQGFKCKLDSPQLESASQKRSAKVKGVEALNAPKFLSAPCPGTTFLTLSNLIPGARVVLTSDGQELGQTDAPDTTYTFTTPPLQAGATLAAYMMLCDKKGPESTKKVKDSIQSPDGVRTSDLYACAAFVYVGVSGSSGNYLLYITNKNGQQISAYHNLVGFYKLIPVSPSLIAGDEITVNLLSCGGSWDKYGPFQVNAGTPPPPSFVEPVVSHKDYVMVASNHAGAVVDVFVNNVWQGNAISVGNLDTTVVHLQNQLVTDDEIFGTQTLCGKASRPSKKIKVKKPKPEAPQLLKPEDEAQNVSIQPLFQWKDPGANHENAAESYQIIVTQGGNEVINTTSTTTQYASATVLQYNTEYEWSVIAKNSTGTKQSYPKFTFTTEDAPEPMAANLHFDPPIYSGTLGFPRNQVFPVYIDVKNQGNIDSSDYVVNFTILSYDQTTIYDSYDVPMQALGAGDTAQAGASIVIYDPNDVRINAYLFVNGQQVDSAFLIA